MSQLDPINGPFASFRPQAPDAGEDPNALERKGILIVDGRRGRSRYFDGRFLAARDLTREQNYVLTREADLGQAAGTGVIQGLTVAQAGPRALAIAAGQGTTSAGELVTIPGNLVIGLDDVPGLELIDATAGVAAVPDVVSPATRSGLYVLVLRPVEYSTRTITKYPVAVNGKRTGENGDIVEAVAISLVPYVADRLDDSVWMQRSHIAAVAFMQQGLRGIPAEALPLAMLRLDKGVIRWLDPYLVRRDVGAEHEAVVGLDLTPRALREAHLLQYDRELGEIVLERKRGAGMRFSASDYFEVLPAAGRMPAAAIDPSDFTQIFFPAPMTVTLSIVPADEVPAMIEESLLGPPIQIAGSPDDLDFTAIQVLIPAPRTTLQSLRPRSIPRLGAIPPIPSLRRPVDVLAGLSGASLAVPAALAPGDPLAAQWRQILGAQGDGLIWFTRRRALSLTMPVAFPVASGT